MEAAATRVLLVEDEPSDALAVGRSLCPTQGPDGERFEVRHVATLAQGLAELLRDPVDVLLLDLCLPDSEGPDTVVRLRDLDARVPIVVFTGVDEPQLVARTLEAGADEYLVKEDLQSALLRRTIRRAIARGRLRLGFTPSLQASRAEPMRPERALLHDLKNVHTSIVGNAQILRTELGDEDFLRRRADALLAAARTAISLTERLLSGTDVPETPGRSVDLSELVRCAEPLLRAVLPERIELRLALSDDLALVVAREERLRCAVLELVVNAVEAIGDTEGSIEIRTGATVVREADVPRLFAPAGFAVGPSVWLEVRDSGRGFDPAGLPCLLARGVTTKGAGRGEGLSTVEQTLAAHRAALLVHSRAREGSAFRILLPSGE